MPRAGLRSSPETNHRILSGSRRRTYLGLLRSPAGASPLTTTLNGLNASIASATLQQAHVVEDINQNVTQAAGLSHSTALAAEQSSVASAHLRGLSDQLDGLLRQFKV